MDKEVIIDIENPKDNDLISKQAVIERLKKENKILYTLTGLNYLIRAIEDLPSVKPQEKTGYWTPLYDYTDERDDHKCSVCGFESMGATRYCPDCGTRMFEL